MVPEVVRLPLMASALADPGLTESVPWLSTAALRVRGPPASASAVIVPLGAFTSVPLVTATVALKPALEFAQQEYDRLLDAVNFAERVPVLLRRVRTDELDEADAVHGPVVHADDDVLRLDDLRRARVD